MVTGPPGGGTVDLVSPDVSKIRHFISDVIPFLLCCKAGIFSNCERYYGNRPSDKGVDFSPPPPPGTVDSTDYTIAGITILYRAIICT